MGGDRFCENVTLNLVELVVEVPDGVVRADGHPLLEQDVARVQARCHDMHGDRGVGFAVEDRPVHVRTPPVFGKGRVVHVHERAARKEASREDPVVGGDDDAIRRTVEDQALHGLGSHVGEHRHAEGTRTLDHLVPSARWWARADHAGDLEPLRQRLERGQGGRAQPEQQHPWHPALLLTWTGHSTWTKARSSAEASSSPRASTWPTFKPPDWSRTIGSGPTADGRTPMWPGAGARGGHTGTAAAASASRSASPQYCTSTAPEACRLSSRAPSSSSTGRLPGCRASRTASQPAGIAWEARACSCTTWAPALTRSATMNDAKSLSQRTSTLLPRTGIPASCNCIRAI